jgi:aryl-alcohol dehydrogenase-like predicted oxidoreductase
MQNLVNLLYREEEREMLPPREAERIGVIPWSPQARGKLSRDRGYTRDDPDCKVVSSR